MIVNTIFPVTEGVVELRFILKMGKEAAVLNTQTCDNL